MDEVHRTIEEVARASYGRLIAYLATRTRDVAAAEDALGDAFLAALNTWPRDGLPRKPEAWLLTTARHRLIDRARHDRRQQAADTATLELLAGPSGAAASGDEFPDERLKLLFVCAHPAIDPAMHTPLMLQTVLGLDAARIARAFLVAPPAMGQRLVRAKAKIRDAGMAFEVPGENELGPRLQAVLEAIYAAYGSGWEDAAGADPRARGLAEEAIWLARLLVEHLSAEPEARGLLALILHCEARRGARRRADGSYVPLSAQDPALWSRPLLEDAETQLTAAARYERPGRFQIEAAIQSAHAERAHTGRTEWGAVAALYAHLVHMTPAFGARVGHAAAVAEADGPEAGLALLDGAEPEAAAAYQPYWAVRAHLLDRLGRRPEARRAFDRAIDLTTDEATRRFLAERRG